MQSSRRLLSLIQGLLFSRKSQVFLALLGCCFFFLGWTLLLHQSPWLWKNGIKFQGSNAAVPDTVLNQPSWQFEVQQQDQKNVRFLANLLRGRLALPNDALKIMHRSPCSEHEDDFLPCVDETCPTLADKPVEERVRDLLFSPQFRLNDQQLKNVLSLASTVHENDVIIASASSSNHYPEMQGMFQALHKTVFPVLRNFSVLLFDLGLKKKQRRKTEKFCRCKVISFPFELFPPHVNDRHCYSWKPLIIRALISKARKLLVWQDTSIRWTNKFQHIFERAYRYGQQFVEFNNDARITANTYPQMFSYMKEEVCSYHAYREVQNSIEVLRNDPLVVKALLNPWTRCALEKLCICPEDPRSIMDCRRDVNVTSHRCHRFDQSAMSILLSKLYAADRYRIIMPEFFHQNSTYVSIKRGDQISHKLRW